MRGLAALAILALALGAIVVVPLACDSSHCKKDTIAAQVYLTAPINLDADRLIVTSIDPPGLDLQATVTGGLSGDNGVTVELSFPHGYVINTVITIEARAFVGPVQLGLGTSTVHTGGTCADTTLYVLPLSKFPPPSTDPDAGS